MTPERRAEIVAMIGNIIATYLIPLVEFSGDEDDDGETLLFNSSMKNIAHFYDGYDNHGRFLIDGPGIIRELLTEIDRLAGVRTP